MKRREFIAGLGGAATWPLVARAQQPTMPVIGFFKAGFPGTEAPLLAAFLRGLGELGYVEGQNVAIEYRWGENQRDRLPVLAADLVRRQPQVIFAGPTGPALAAKAATKTIPIVFTSGGDPVEYGLVTSLSRPEGNLTGMSFMGPDVEAKRLGLLHELMPQATAIAALLNPASLPAEKYTKQLEATARALGLQIRVLHARSENEIDAAFEAAAKWGAHALEVTGDSLFVNQREQLIAQAARQSLPTIYEWREVSEAGGLISYGPVLTEAYRQAGIYVGRILKGAKPADLPIMQPTKFELVINLKTAKALGLEIPPQLLARADEVIE